MPMAWRSFEWCNSISAMPNKKLAIRFSNWAAEVDLLRNGDNANATLTPIGQHVHAFLETASYAVELPHHNGVDLAGEDGGLQFLKSIAVQVSGALTVPEPTCAFDMVALNPGLQLGSLAIGLLALGRGNADINGSRYAK